MWNLFVSGDAASALLSLLPHQSCHHTTPTLTCCVLFALSLSTLFVVNLYILVPSKIRKLPRNNATHIRWRSFGSACSVLLSIVVYPMIFCQLQLKPQQRIQFESTRYLDASLWDILGWSRWTARPLVHAIILYLGPIFASVIRLHIATLNNTLHYQGKKASSLSLFSSMNTYRHELLDRIRFKFSLSSAYGNHNMSENERAALLRDLIIAPLVEEMIFRSCIVPPFLSVLNSITHQNHLSVKQISWITPLFFGMAHIHHAIRLLRKCEPHHANLTVKNVLFNTTFQFVYTTLFGAYVSFAFIKTASLPGVVIVHSFCNWMGFPDLDSIMDVYAGSRDAHGYALVLHKDLVDTWIVRWYRRIVGVAFGVGVVCFGLGFSRRWGLFPEEDLLRQLVVRN